MQKRNESSGMVLKENAIPDSTEIEAAVAEGNRTAVLALFHRQRIGYEKMLREERTQYKTAIRKKVMEFRALADNFPDGIMRFDRDFRITYANPIAAEIMRTPPQDILGKTPGDFSLPPHLVSLWQGGLLRVFATGRGETFEYEFDDLHTVRHLRIDMIPEYGPDNSVESVLTLGIER